MGTLLCFPGISPIRRDQYFGTCRKRFPTSFVNLIPFRSWRTNAFRDWQKFRFRQLLTGLNGISLDAIRHLLPPGDSKLSSIWENILVAQLDLALGKMVVCGDRRILTTRSRLKTQRLSWFRRLLSPSNCAEVVSAVRSS